MNVVCAWCGAFLRSVPAEVDALQGRDSHGICEDCSKRLLEELGVPVEQFLSELGAPVLLVNDDVRVLDANAAAVNLLGGSRQLIISRMGGEVFECRNSRLPGGCGRTVHCSGCVLRRTVTSTWRTGRTFTRIPATLEVARHGEATQIAFLVTTAKIGDRVVVRIDPPTEDPEAPTG